MYNAKPSQKSNSVPSDVQAREKLAMYVYEYMLHHGAGKAAHLFLQEIGWEKSISLGESPGFLHSWWGNVIVTTQLPLLKFFSDKIANLVFWDLYSASPERRETNEHSPEAKAFHDYNAATASPLMGAMTPEGMPLSTVPAGYFPPGSSTVSSPHHNSAMMRQPFMGNRFASGGPRPGMQVQGPGQQSIYQTSEHPRQGQMLNMGRMVHPRGIPPGLMNPYAADQFQQGYGGMRMPASTMPSHNNMGMPIHHSRLPWPNPSGPSGAVASVPPTTPIMRSPQDAMASEYGHMGKPMQHQQMPSSVNFSMNNMPDNMPTTSMPPGPPVSGPNMTPGMNGMNGSGPEQSMLLEGLAKGSPSQNLPMGTIGPGGPANMGPAGGPGGTPHTPQEGERDFLVGYGDNRDTDALLKIEESIQQDVDLFETHEGDGNVGNDFGYLP